MTKFNHLKLKSIIVGSGRTQNDVKGAIGKHYNTVSQWVRGIATPSPDDLYKVLMVCGYTPEQINELRLVDFYPIE